MPRLAQRLQPGPRHFHAAPRFSPTLLRVLAHPRRDQGLLFKSSEGDVDRSASDASLRTSLNPVDDGHAVDVAGAGKPDDGEENQLFEFAQAFARHRI